MKTIIFYSGSAGAIKGGSLPGEPEYVLKDDANIMLSYFLITNHNQDQHNRLPKIIEGRTNANRTRKAAARSGKRTTRTESKRDR